MTENPYQNPAPPSQTTPPMLQDRDPLSILKVPGIILAVLAAISILNVVSGLVIRVYTGTFEFGSAQFFIGIIVGLVICSVQLAILAGGIQMARGIDHNTCNSAAIFACLPVCSPCLVAGIPFGIWAFVLLSKDEVKEAMSSESG